MSCLGHLEVLSFISTITFVVKTTAYIQLFLLVGAVMFAQPTNNATPINVQPAEHCQLRYTYYPNLDTYFDLWNQTYWFRWQGQWWQAEQLPEWLGGYSIFKKVYVLIPDYDDDDIVLMLPGHRKRYPYIFNTHSVVFKPSCTKLG